MASTVKLEMDNILQNVCHGCLCTNRNLKSLSSDNTKLFYSLIGSEMLYGSKDGVVCWECEAILKRVRKFQNQIRQAQNRLIDLLYTSNMTNIQSLSTLSTTTKDYNDQNYEYIPQEIYPQNSIPTTHIDCNDEQNSIIKIEDFKLELNQYSDEDYQDTDYVSKTESPEKKKNKLNKNYLKHAVVKNLENKFVDVDDYFKEEFLDDVQVEELVVRPDQELNYWIGYKCKECKLNFRSQTTYLLHENLTHYKPASPIICLLCNENQSSLDKLRGHWKYKHSAYARCKLCNTYCSRKAKKRHLNIQHTKLYCCTKCNGEFRCLHHFNRHYKKEHDRYICHHCERVYNSKTSLIRHLNGAHSERHICTVCRKEFKTRRYLLKHMAYHPETLKKKVNKESAYCVECNRQYPTVEQFKRHIIVSPKHNYKPPQSIPCPQCGKIFKRRSYMTNHLYHVHMREKAKYKCSVCDKYYANNWGLKLHYKTIHLKIPKEKDKVCDICGRAFHTNRILINHRRTHTGERPYRCSYCTASFSQQQAMYSHQKSQHREMLINT